MTCEVPQVPPNEAIYPRTPENFPQPGLFNVDAMPDDYIAMLGRSLDGEHVRMSGQRSTREEEVAATELMGHLGADIAQMVMTNPERGRAFMSRLVQSDNVHERNVAASAAVPLAFRGDYEFARDTLLTAYERELNEHDPSDLADAYLNELASVLKSIRPDLARDLEQRAADIQTSVYGPDPGG